LSLNPFNSESTDVDTVVSEFCDYLSNAVSASSSTERVNNVSYKQPWATADYIALCRRRNLLYGRKRKKQDNYFILAEYNEVCNQITSLKRRLKSEHYSKLFVTATSNPRKRWKILNSIVKNSDVSLSTGVSKLISNNECLQTPLQISEAFNSHFAAVGRSYSESFKENFVLLPDLFRSVIPSIITLILRKYSVLLTT